ncbi:restriction endonuclease subunit S domain-containing protein [Campylobacter coli]|uniref:restriction endonuclease subunit S n=1 Tax=Campylobacter coli TaxID=195 RepID=UPI0003D28224|nr:restriction endonuclease subunit S [Campylobacter coli]EAJ4166322.1 restriction endonuclease subunit S [Campylobacter coli]EAJ4507482.1 restriction endonuclease subunit S [Campylobacter coli]EAJ5293357.1 restriction endonuclease subunit S [Campylobacter coli]ECO3380044.1 restriction endonuclease subunit S [Campylobacter coli]EDO8926875.1 restriction endonuclease subunit S [Campylobacter coli]
MNLNQTLQEKYPHLEVSVFSYSKVKEHLIFGSEFNSNTRENAIQSIVSNKNVNDYFELINTNVSTLKEFIYIYDLTHSLGNFMIDVEPTQEIGSNKKEAIKGDFVISRLRSYLKEMAVIQSKNFKQLLSTEYLVYRPKTNLLSSNTLLAFSLSRIVQTILNYSQYGTEHPRFYEFVFNEMPIPKCLLLMNAEIDSIMNKAYEVLEQSKIFYKKAEETLYLELGLDPKNPLQSLLDSKTNIPTNSLNISIRTLKESFLKTGRLDSEYYQSKYEDIEKFIKSYPNGYDSFSNIINNKDTNFTPKNNENYSYIELANIGNNGNISEPISDLGKNLPTRARRIVSKGDVIISSIEGSLSSCALITQEFDKHLVSTGFFVLNSKLLNGETLLVMFKSQIFQEYLKKFPSGTILCAINKEELSKILIPKIDPTTQEKIAKYIQESFNLRKKSKQLLDNAKNKVEEQIQGKI